MEDIKMAKNYRKSDYAKNKFSEGIVYTFNDGSEVELLLLIIQLCTE